MASELVKVAPDVKIMPVRIHTFEWPDDYEKTEYPRRLIEAIEYSIRNGADVISISQPPVPDEWQAQLDEVAQKAADAGVTIVYIHYYGQRKDVVIPSAIEAAKIDAAKRQEHVYVVCTGFIDESSFPNTFGLSVTAPIVAGVVAMMKEKNPDLKPAEIHDILLNTGRPIKSGHKILDAYKALQRVR
jgi:subtilisin family serine protease